MNAGPDALPKGSFDLSYALPISRAPNGLALRMANPAHGDDWICVERPRKPNDRTIHVIDRKTLLNWEWPVEQFGIVELRGRAGNVRHDGQRILVPNAELFFQPSIICGTWRVFGAPFLPPLHRCYPGREPPVIREPIPGDGADDAHLIGAIHAHQKIAAAADIEQSCVWRDR